MLKITRGDTNTIEITVTDLEGQPVDLTDCTAVFTMRRDVFNAEIILVKTVTEFTDNVVEVPLEPEDTEDLLGRYYWDLQITSEAGIIRSSDVQYLLIDGDITREAEVS